MITIKHLTYEGIPKNYTLILEPDANQNTLTVQITYTGQLTVDLNKVTLNIAGKSSTTSGLNVTKDVDSTNNLVTFTIPISSISPSTSKIPLTKMEASYGKTPIGQISFLYEGETLEAAAETDVTNVKLERADFDRSPDQVLWPYILQNIPSFPKYQNFIDYILGRPLSFPTVNGKEFDRKWAHRNSPFIKSEEYNLVKFATDFYMLATLNLDPAAIKSYLSNGKYLPYYEFVIERIMADIRASYQNAGTSGLLQVVPPSIIKMVADKIFELDDDEITESFKLEITKHLSKFQPSGGDERYLEEQRLEHPIFIELIWNYWMEQGMLVQTMNMINLRFQNIKVHKGTDPLMRFDADPLRPLSHMIWGYIQDEQHRLSVNRRYHEYDHEYGLILTGRAVKQVDTVDPRVRFLEAFHNLLNACILFYREYDNTTIVADGFPTLNNLREVHLLLAEGNHNSYGDLTWTARQEMLMQQYILARPEMREFIGGRVMVPYPEGWMDRVDTMKAIQGWGNSDILSYYELAVHGERILLAIRYGNWSNVTLTQDDAANWAVSFRNSIQRYVHAYRVVTGVDLTAERLQDVRNYATQPSTLIQQRFGKKTELPVRPKVFITRGGKRV